MQNPRHVRLFRNGRNQAVRIPRELELDAEEAIIHKEGDRLILEPIPKKGRLADLLAGWEPLEEDESLPRIEDRQVRPEDVF